MKLSTAFRLGMQRCRPTPRGALQFAGYDKQRHACGCALGTLSMGLQKAPVSYHVVEDIAFQRIRNIPPISTLPEARHHATLFSQINAAYEIHHWSRRRIYQALVEAGL